MEDAQAFLEGYKLIQITFILKSLGDTYYSMDDFINASFYYEEYLKYCNNCSGSEAKQRVGNY